MATKDLHSNRSTEDNFSRRPIRKVDASLDVNYFKRLMKSWDIIAEGRLAEISVDEDNYKLKIETRSGERVVGFSCHKSPSDSLDNRVIFYEKLDTHILLDQDDRRAYYSRSRIRKVLS